MENMNYTHVVECSFNGHSFYNDYDNLRENMDSFINEANERGYFCKSITPITGTHENEGTFTAGYILLFQLASKK